MNATTNKVLACVDQSHFADYVADYASWAARRMDAPLELLHILDREAEVASGDDHSGAIGFDAQETLLTEALRGGRGAQQGPRAGPAVPQPPCASARSRRRRQPDMRQRYGDLEETLVEQEDGALFVLGRRGESAETTQRDLGRNVERMVRALQQPILAVTEEFTEPQRVMIAFDGKP
jgi:nucleotide-binding universal stress UspA family protein